MRKLSTDDYRSMPWKNGGGVTTELAIHPPGAGLDDFDWRISSAQVSMAGPFSHFAGIDRSLAVLGGGGMVLRGMGRGAVTLTPASLPLAFRGEEELHAELVDGPTTDFNVMTRRTRWAHILETLHLRGARQLIRNADQILFYCVQGSQVVCSAAAQSVMLNAGEAVLIDRADGSSFELDAPQPALLYIVQLIHRGTSHA